MPTPATHTGLSVNSSARFSRARIIAAAAARSGLSGQWITHLENSEAAIEFLETRLRPEDVVLVKGSRGVQMDLIVAALEARD